MAWNVCLLAQLPWGRAINCEYNFHGNPCQGVFFNTFTAYEIAQLCWRWLIMLGLASLVCSRNKGGIHHHLWFILTSTATSTVTKTKGYLVPGTKSTYKSFCHWHHWQFYKELLLQEWDLFVCFDLWWITCEGLSWSLNIQIMAMPSSLHESANVRKCFCWCSKQRVRAAKGCQTAKTWRVENVYEKLWNVVKMKKSEKNLVLKRIRRVCVKMSHCKCFKNLRKEWEVGNVCERYILKKSVQMQMPE